MRSFLKYAVVASLATGLINVANAATHYDTAAVVSVTPITRMVHVPDMQQECWNESIINDTSNDSDSTTSTIVGGIVGGVVGNQFGKGKGKTAATVAGTLLGGSVGHDMSTQDSSPTERVIRRCRSIDHGYDEERIEGYSVKYKYQGATYTTRMHKDPGETLRVRVETKVTPVVGR